MALEGNSMRDSQEGMTLVEVCASMVLMAMLLQYMTSYFGVFYQQQRRVTEAIYWEQEARTIEEAITEYIRTMDLVRIITEKGNILEKSSDLNEGIVQGRLKRIEGAIIEPRSSGSGNVITRSFLVVEPLVSVNEEEKQYKLSYGIPEEVSRNLISSEIKTIAVSSDCSSNRVYFEVEFILTNREMMRTCFEIDLSHKAYDS